MNSSLTNHYRVVLSGCARYAGGDSSLLVQSLMVRNTSQVPTAAIAMLVGAQFPAAAVRIEPAETLRPA